MPAGEELSKLIINNYILNNSNLNLNIDEKKKLALKYQLFTKYASLFAEVELSNEIKEEMKLIIIGNKENNQINEIRPSNSFNYKSFYGEYERPPKRTGEVNFPPRLRTLYGTRRKKSAFSLPSFDGIVNPFKCLFSFFSFGSKDTKNEIIEKRAETYKENIMEMIASQDFIEGSWNINKKTKIIKKKYEKEFDLLKNLKDKNIDDKIAITILIIYFINKEHSELLKELILIIKKGKLFIQEKTKNTYENIIKEIEN